ncbi:MAG: hypothetical protein LBT00_03995 [Spirochaetaceae bacterium]|nr:hypothetical protein [Spirochaetaceae bacterium]
MALFSRHIDTLSKQYPSQEARYSVVFARHIDTLSKQNPPQEACCLVLLSSPVAAC